MDSDVLSIMDVSRSQFCILMVADRFILLEEGSIPIATMSDCLHGRFASLRSEKVSFVKQGFTMLCNQRRRRIASDLIGRAVGPDIPHVAVFHISDSSAVIS